MELDEFIETYCKCCGSILCSGARDTELSEGCRKLREFLTNNTNK